ncbi:hypothetical protein H2248_012646 [Termitomyces sp. 'cryptogamus']|nr:hypothetical protein H2248_012646 [Termitomyces sp. 'cryptogamus']
MPSYIVALCTTFRLDECWMVCSHFPDLSDLDFSAQLPGRSNSIASPGPSLHKYRHHHPTLLSSTPLLILLSYSLLYFYRLSPHLPWFSHVYIFINSIAAYRILRCIVYIRDELSAVSLHLLCSNLSIQIRFFISIGLQIYFCSLIERCLV